MPLFPTSLHNITLGQWIDYTNSLQPLDDALKTVQDLPDCQRKSVMLTRNYVDRAYHTYAFFGGADTPVVDDVLKEYNDVFCRLFDDVEGSKEVIGLLPSFELTETNPITFGQFIDAKMLTNGEGNRWEQLQYVCAIFRTSNYKSEDCEETSGWFIEQRELKMPYALAVSQWWESLNTYINNNYTLFQDAGGSDDGGNMKEHMKRWGWINFLKSIAKTKAFDIDGSGLNSIDAARKTKAATVLIWASEEKDYNLSLSRDMEDSYKNR